MTAVESCPVCDRGQRRATRRCDWCGAEFDRVIEPPPGIRWWVFMLALLIVGAAVMTLVMCTSASGSQSRGGEHPARTEIIERQPECDCQNAFLNRP